MELHLKNQRTHCIALPCSTNGVKELLQVIGETGGRKEATRKTKTYVGA
jgi:hypothetical protein